MDKIIVFTANIGKYDKVENPKVIDPSVRYILFTDDYSFKSSVWEVRYVDNLREATKTARYIKIMCQELLPPHDWSIWFDASFVIKVPSFSKMIKENDIKSEIACYKHPIRNCTYKEAEVCINAKLDGTELIKKQVIEYQSQGFPKNAGLFATGIIIRKNTTKIKTFCEHWWKEVESKSKRDQLSQVYSSWKTSVKISNIKVGESIYKNSYTEKKKHILPRILMV
jgi:hypothetical protein